MRLVTVLFLLSLCVGCATGEPLAAANLAAQDAALALQRSDAATIERLAAKLKTAKRSEIRLAMQLDLAGKETVPRAEALALAAKAVELADRIDANVELVVSRAAADPNWGILFQALQLQGDWAAAYRQSQELLRDVVRKVRGED